MLEPHEQADQYGRADKVVNLSVSGDTCSQRDRRRRSAAAATEKHRGSCLLIRFIDFADSCRQFHSFSFPLLTKQPTMTSLQCNPPGTTDKYIVKSPLTNFSPSTTPSTRRTYLSIKSGPNNINSSEECLHSLVVIIPEAGEETFP